MEKQKIALMAVIFILIAVMSFFLTKESDKPALSENITDNNFEIDIQNNFKLPEIKITAKTELSLAGLDLGTDIKQMHDILGKETYQKTDGDYQIFDYNFVQVGIKNGIVDSLISDNESVQTKRNLHKGSDLKEIIDQYGSNYLKSQYENLVLYEYKFEDLLSRPGILRFAVNGSTNKIEYVGVRNSTEESAEDKAKQTLKNYYQYITETNFQKAYSILSWEMQNIMGTYETFSRGYDTTISSTAQNIFVISNNGNEFILEYDLIARDRLESNRVKVQNFKGTATLKFIEEKWCIDNMTVRKLGEYIE